LTQPGVYQTPGGGASHHHVTYPLAPTLLLRFALTFDGRFEKKRLPWLYPAALAFGVGLNALFIAAVRTSSIEAFRAQQRWTSAFRWYLVAVLGAALVLFVRSYLRAGRAEDKARLKWVFYGTTVGLAPFVLFYQIPRALGRAPLIPEELTTLLMILVPAAFALAVFKFRLMDVDLVINRSLVYSLLTVALVSFYLISLELLRGLFSRWGPARERWVALAAAVLAAGAFHPARRSIQRLVDRAFFRRSFDFRACLARFGASAQTMGRRESLAGLFRAAVEDALAIGRTGVCLRGRKADGQESLFQAGLDDPTFDRLKALDWGPGHLYGRTGGAAALAAVDESRWALLEDAGLDLVIALSGPLSGFAAFGPKRSGQRLDGEDIELLLALTSELGVHLERIRLQDEVIYEQAVRRSLVELDRMKTEFIAAVSHELRTPLGSLQSLSEILSAGRARGADETNRLLGMMASECGRLSRFIHNVLDYGKIELEVKTYAKAPVDLRRLVEDAAGLFGPGLEREGGRLTTGLPGAPVVLAVDADAVMQALVNILDNAVKYARPPKEVGVALEETPAEVRIEVADNGIGIAPADQARIFEGFARTAEAVRANPGGVGLGLKIVKHIMNAHGGAVELRSEPGRGSRLKLIFKRS
jgi:signal transduction histidine kinase